MNTSHPQRTTSDGQQSCLPSSPRRLRRGVGLLAASIAIAGLAATPVLLTATIGTASAQQETPEQRCARQTAEYNAAMEAAWRAAHPGQTPGAGAWPAFVCQELPELPSGGGTGGTGGGVSGESTPGRDHQYEGFDHSNVYQQDMQVGAPRTGLSDRMGGSASTTAPRAVDSARSNVPKVPAWASPRLETVTDADGSSRQVRVIDTDQGVAIIDESGRATGEIIDNDRDRDRGGSTSTRDVEGLAGVNLLDQRDAGSSDGPDDGGGDDRRDPRSPVGPGPLGAMAAAAGGIGVLTNRRRGSKKPVSTRPAVSATSTRPGGTSSRPSVSGLTAPSLGGVPGLDGAPRVTVNHLTGAQQTIFALLSPESDHTQDFELDVPDGGQAIIRDDGGVDVVDADGDVVSQVDPPWAFDALGRPQKTWYTYDPATGLLTQHVEPTANALYPIIADPNKSSVGGIDTTGQEEGVPWTQDLGNGEVAERVIVPGTGGQTVDTRVSRDDGSFTDIRTTENDLGGVDTWSNNSNGTAAYRQTDLGNDSTYIEGYDESPVPGYTPDPVTVSNANYDNSEGGFVANNPDGTQTTGQYQRTADNQYQTTTLNGDGSTSEITSTQRADGGISTAVSDDNGTRVTTDGVNNIPLDEHGNDVSQSDNPDAGSGRFYNPDTGEFVNGAIVEDVDTPVYRMDDGSLVYGMNNDEGGTDWVTTRPNGESAVVRELDWAPDGSPIIVDQDPFVSDAVESATGVPIFTGADATGAVYGIGTDTPVNMAELGIRNDVAAGRMSQEVGDDLLKGLKWSGRALGAAGTGLSIVNDVRGGESFLEATTTNTAGAVGGAAVGGLAGAGFVAGATALGVTAPVWGTAVVVAGGAAVAGWAITKGAKSLWNWVAD